MPEARAAQVGADEFVRGLTALPTFTPHAVFDYIKAHPVRAESLRPYLFFSPASYTRNLIFKDERFELLAIGWEVGQVSRVHNHRDQQCWMAVPVGKLRNQNYRVVERDPAKKTCRLEESAVFMITPESPAEVDQEEPVHQVQNLAEFGQRAVSLHIYSKPFDTCEVYSLEKGSYADVPLCYTSEYGKVCAGEQASLAD
jgi:cysteine dioxygenase